MKCCVITSAYCVASTKHSREKTFANFVDYECYSANHMSNDAFHILDVIFGEDSKEESCGEKTDQLFRKHGTLGTSSGSVKKQADKQGKENFELKTLD